MNLRTRTPTIIITLLFLVVSNLVFGWGWKRATSVEDLTDFLNGTGVYSRSVSNFRLSAISRSGGVEFLVFYEGRQESVNPSSWGWKLATTPDDVLNFLNGQSPYGNTIRNVQISVIRGHSGPHFYIVYQREPFDAEGNWGWKLATDPNDVMNFLNGDGGYERPVTTARIAEYRAGGYDAFFVFYQRGTEAMTIPNWAWKRSYNFDDALNFINGTDGYRNRVMGYEIGSINRKQNIDSHIFYNKGTKIWVPSPLKEERYVQGETISMRAILTSDQVLDPSELIWTSDRHGVLGRGASLDVNTLTLGNHRIIISGYGTQEIISVRIFADLWAFYQAAPAEGEIARIRKDFTINKVNGTGVDEDWSVYDELTFDQTSPDPTELVIIAKLDVLRHQRFSQPLPFTDGKTIYEHLITHVHTLNLFLSCMNNNGGGGTINFARNISVWDPRLAGSPDDPACKSPFDHFELFHYNFPLSLIVHEGRHSEPDDPGHTVCRGRSNDLSLEPGSGYAQSALYNMWVYKYGLYDPEFVKAEVRASAKSALQSNLCSPPMYSNPLVQELIDELLE